MQIEREHAFGIEEARGRVDKVAAKLAEKFQLRSVWRDDSLHVSGGGSNGVINVEPGKVTVDVRLGLAMKMFESTVRSGIESALDRYLT